MNKHEKNKVPAETPHGLPVVAIPTTAGTGSEATRVAIVTDSETQEKMLCMGPGLLPAAALVDFELTMGKPMRLTADSGLDALCHALEAFVSRKANPFTDSLALTAMSAITSNLRRACDEPGDRQARERLMLASTQAGIAFSNASVTLIHGMSRPIGAFFHVPHGLSNAMLLPSVTAFSLPGAQERYAQASRAMGFADVSASDAQANVALMDGLLGLTSDLRVPTLKEFGVDKATCVSHVSKMAQQVRDLAAFAFSFNSLPPPLHCPQRLVSRHVPSCHFKILERI